MTKSKRIELAQRIATELFQSAKANDWPEAGLAAVRIMIAIERNGDLIAALENAWDVVEPENPEFGARIRDVIDNLPEPPPEPPPAPRPGHTPCIKCGSVDRNVTFLPLGYSGTYHQIYGVGAPLAELAGGFNRTTQEWLLNHCRGCQREWLTAPLDRAQ